MGIQKEEIRQEVIKILWWKIITIQTQAVSTKIKGKQGVKDFLEKKTEENRGLIWKNSTQFMMTLNVFGPGDCG